MRALSNILSGLAPMLAILLLWQVVTAAGLFPPQVLVSPAAVVRAFLQTLDGGELATHLADSLTRLLTGYAIGAVLGLAFGSAMAVSRLFDTAFGPLFQALRQVPVLAFLPMLVLLLGIEEQFKITVVALACFFPVALAACDGVRDVPRRHFEVARLYRVPLPVFVWRILLPAALPAILTGLRLGLTRAWLVLVACELLAADSGIGQMMEMGRQMFRIDVVLVGVFVSGLVGFILDRSVKLIEKRATRWKEA